MIDNVICVCMRRDLPTFAVAARYIAENIEAGHYRVVVPEADLALFSEAVSSPFQVISEEIYSELRDCLKARMGPHRDKFGWYFQQFIKISELMRGSPNSLNLIWDADTVPLKLLTFEREGKVLYYHGHEHHQPYFELIESLTGLQKQVRSSFIAQCFPSRSGWVRAFVADIEKNNGRPWYEALCDHIDFSQDAGFSEYETLGTFQYARFNGEMAFNDHLWSRYGNSQFGGIEKLKQYDRKLARRYDFIAYEAWDEPRFSVKNTLRRYWLLYV